MITYSFTIYVAGQARESQDAEVKLRGLCESRLAGRYDLKVVDVFEQPAVAEQDGVVVVPTVVRTGPLPQLRVIGDLSDEVRTAAGLGFPDPLIARRQDRDDE
ncbi:circadian clock KaiB family protein [Actinopolymorpha sp. B17G11]|uniref:circadian clock KaiB family protein n=1 Tax=Actinopolymorpha sp. B17G11 TaxID=3160861 RepID=UPI0032E51B73